jgi:hypothetical protein
VFSRRDRLGSSLIETLVALVLMTGCVLLVGALLHRAQRYQRRSESLLEASALANQVSGEVRLWAQTPSNFDGDWSFWNGRQFQEPNFPNLWVRVDISNPLTLYSPDRLSESAFSDPRQLSNGGRCVRISAGPDLASSLGRVRIWTQIAPPRPDPSAARIEVTGATNLAVGSSAGYTAEAYIGARRLPQVCFVWRIHDQSGSGSGSSPQRDGRNFTLSHNQSRESAAGGTEPAFGNIELVAEARIGGRLVRGARGVILDP